MIRHRIEVDHYPDCKAVKSVLLDDHHIKKSWSGVFDQEPLVFANSLGHIGRGHRIWWRVRCNNPDCPGRLLICSEDVFRFLQIKLIGDR